MLTNSCPISRRRRSFVEEISAACREQDVGADQVSQAIQQLDKVIQQNAGAAEELSSRRRSWRPSRKAAGKHLVLPYRRHSGGLIRQATGWQPARQGFAASLRARADQADELW